jgi:hypothetical protein
MDTVTTATARIPHPGHPISCTASTACPVTVLGVDHREAALLLADHVWVQHRAGRKEN